jgi:hypothetical protein
MMSDQECAVDSCLQNATRTLRYTPVSSQETQSVSSLCRTHYFWRRFVGVGGGIVISVVLFGSLFFWETVYLPGPQLIMEVLQSLLLATVSVFLWGLIISIIE